MSINKEIEGMSFEETAAYINTNYGAMVTLFISLKK